LRDKAREIGKKETYEVIQDNAIVARTTFSGPEFQVLVAPSLRIFFEKHIQSTDNQITADTATNNDEEKRVKSNYLFLKSEFEKYCDGLSPSQVNEKIQYIFDFLKNVRVIATKIYDENDAYEIFESVNATGVDLNVADLLKNFLFKKVRAEGGSTTEVNDRWNEIVNLIAESGVDLPKFIRYYWLSKYPTFVSESKLFKSIKNNQTIISWRDFLKDLQENAQVVYELRNFEEIDQSVRDSSKIKKHLAGLKAMNILQCYVLLMAIYRNKDKINFKWVSIFEVIEKFNFLYHAISKLPANRVEKLYHEFAYSIELVIANESDPETLRTSLETISHHIKDKLRTLVPEFEVFKAGFVQVSYKKRALCHYILRSMEEKMHTDEFIIDQSSITLEHILPKKPGLGWDLNVSDIKSYVDNIGNLTLLGHAANSRLGNRSLKEKIEFLEESEHKTEVTMTKELIQTLKELDSWNEVAIRNRSLLLAETAYKKIWTF
jgi:hypothetical protein